MFRKKIISIITMIALIMSFGASVSFADAEAEKIDINEVKLNEAGLYDISLATFYLDCYMYYENLVDTITRVDEDFMEGFWYYDYRVSYDGEELIEDEDYVVSRQLDSQNTEASVTFRGIGNYYGEKTFYFKVISDFEGEVNASEVTYHSVVLTWDTVKDMDGYRIVTEDWNTDKILSTKDVPGGDTCSYTLDGLIPDMSYYVKVVPYTISGEQIILHSEYGMGTSFETKYCYVGKFYSSNKKVQKSLNRIFKKYPYCSKWKGSGQCWGYAEWASKQIAKSRKYVKINKSLTAKNVKKYVCNLPTGTHLRITNHSLVILKASKDRIYWTDGNAHCGKGANRVHYWSGTPEEFEDIYYAHAKLIGAYKTTKYR